MHGFSMLQTKSSRHLLKSVNPNNGSSNQDRLSFVFTGLYHSRIYAIIGILIVVFTI